MKAKTPKPVRASPPLPSRIRDWNCIQSGDLITASLGPTSTLMRFVSPCFRYMIERITEKECGGRYSAWYAAFFNADWPQRKNAEFKPLPGWCSSYTGRFLFRHARAACEVHRRSLIPVPKKARSK